MEQQESERRVTPALLIVKDHGAKDWRGTGTRVFPILPRMGEYIELSIGE